jgi:hypothetical protein
MEIHCYPRLSKKQIENLPKDYVCPPVEGTYLIDDEYPEGVIFIYVGYCDWEHNFNNCLREFVLTVFHETMHVLLAYEKLSPQVVENCVPYSEKILAEILDY